MSTISAELQLKTGAFHAAFSRVDASLVKMQRRVVGLESAFKGFAWMGGAALAGVAAVAVKLKSAFDLGGQLSDLSANTGMAASDVLVLRQAFANAGMGAGDLQGNIARLQKALAGTNEEGQSTNAALQRLGLAAGQIDGLNAAQQIKRLQQAFAAIPDPAERTRTAMELFGKSGAKMLALLGDSRALELAGEQVGALGALMDENAGKFDKISDAVTTLAGLKMDQLFSGFAAELAGSADGIEKLSTVDLTGVGEEIAMAAKNTFEFGKSVTGLIQKLPGIKGIQAVMDKVGFRTWGDVAKDSQLSSLRKRNDAAETKFGERMADPLDRASLLNDVAAAADEARARLAAADKEWEGYGPERIAAVKKELSGHIGLLDTQAATLRALGAAAQASGEQQVEAAQKAAEAYEQLKKQHDGWKKDREKLAKDIPAFWKDQQIDDADGPAAKRKVLADRLGVKDVAGIDSEIKALQKSLAIGQTSNTGNEIARIKELMDARGKIAGWDREIAGEKSKNFESAKKEARDNAAKAKEKDAADKQSRADQLLDPGGLPRLQVWASASRALGLGGGAADNAKDIARLHADRQREANGLLKEIRDALKNKPHSLGGELVFS